MSVRKYWEFCGDSLFSAANTSKCVLESNFSTRCVFTAFTDGASVRGASSANKSIQTKEMTGKFKAGLSLQRKKFGRHVWIIIDSVCES